MRNDFITFLKNKLDSKHNVLILKNDLGKACIEQPRFGGRQIFPEIKKALKQQNMKF